MVYKREDARCAEARAEEQRAQLAGVEAARAQAEAARALAADAAHVVGAAQRASAAREAERIRHLEARVVAAEEVYVLILRLLEADPRLAAGFATA